MTYSTYSIEYNFEPILLEWPDLNIENYKWVELKESDWSI